MAITWNTTLTPQVAQSIDTYLDSLGTTGGVNIPQAAPPAPQIVDDLMNMDTQQSLAQGMVDALAARIEKVHSPMKNSQLKMQETYHYSAMKMNKKAVIEFEKKHTYLNPPMKWVTTDGIVGIEVEVENICEQIPLKAVWGSKPDGSLRNNGVELVSCPINVRHIQASVEHMFTALNAYNKPDFSNRTSIHVHLNCRDLTQDQLWTLVILYSIFEKHFYKFSGTKRLSSIFCVPVYRTNILRKLDGCIYGLTGNGWHKYCGINLIPMFDNQTNAFGTVEFRHLYGVNDPKVLMDWINNILCLRKAALSITKEELLSAIKTMNTTSSYMALYHNVFNGVDKLLSDKRDFEDCVSSVKRAFFTDDYRRVSGISTNSKYVHLVNSPEYTASFGY